MNKFIYLFLFLFLSSEVYSQIDFEEGYFVSNSGETTQCLIKNAQWRNNPSEFLYKLSEDAPVKKITIKSAKEVVIINSHKYIRASVNIDQSYRKNLGVDLLSKQREPEYIKQEVF